MQILQVDLRNAELESTSSKLIVRAGGERRATVPLKTIDRLVVTNTARLPVALIAELVDQGAGILLVGSGFSRRQPLHLLPARSDASLRLAQYSAAMEARRGRTYAARFVIAKLQGQAELLQEWADNGRSDRRLLRETADRLDRAAQALLTGSTQWHEGNGKVLTSEGLKGVEGAAAAAFFKVMRSVFPQSLGFSGRNRQPPRDPVNACLSLAYTLAHHEALLALGMRGFDPAVGFLHEPLPGRDSLACDLTEPMRPLAERFVHDLFHLHGLRSDHFSQSGDNCLLGKAGRRLFYETHAEHLAPGLAATAREQALWLKAELLDLNREEISKIIRMGGEPDGG